MSVEAVRGDVMSVEAIEAQSDKTTASDKTTTTADSDKTTKTADSDKTGEAGDGQSWRDLRVVSWLLRGVVLLAPFAASFGCGLAFAWVISRPNGVGQIVWWLGLLAVSVLALAVVERVARRLLPLAALLRLTLVFPDQAPSRLGVALRTLSTGRMRKWASELAADSEEQGNNELAARATAVLSLAAALSAHDRRTRGHSERVGVLTALVAEEMGLDEETQRHLQWAAILHDIGKLTVPKDVLNKSGAPDKGEWAMLQQHPVEGARIAAPLEVWLGVSAGAIAQHHERYDGAGYPLGLEGDDISLAGRLVSVTDAFETMTAVRSYKRPMSVAAARRELTDCAGSHFDPDVVRAFLNVSLGRLYWKVGVASWIAQLPFLGVLPRAGAQIGSFTGGTASGVATASVASFVVGAGLSLGGLPASTTDRPMVWVSYTQPAAEWVSDDGGAGRGGDRDWLGHRVDALVGADRDWVADTNASETDDADTSGRDPAGPATDADDSSSVVDAALPNGPGAPAANGGTPPGQTFTSPGQGGTPPGHGGTPPGQGGTPPGQTFTPPGQVGTPPGQGGTPPGQTVNPPGQGGTPPGQSVTPPGHGGTAPGQGGTPPGQSAAADNVAAPPGQAEK